MRTSRPLALTAPLLTLLLAACGAGSDGTSGGAPPPERLAVPSLLSAAEQEATRVVRGPNALSVVRVANLPDPPEDLPDAAALVEEIAAFEGNFFADVDGDGAVETVHAIYDRGRKRTYFAWTPDGDKTCLLAWRDGDGAYQLSALCGTRQDVVACDLVAQSCRSCRLGVCQGCQRAGDGFDCPALPPPVTLDDDTCVMAVGESCVRVVEHASEDVCARWSADRRLRAPSPWTPAAGACNPGTLSEAGAEDAVRRTNLYRWLVGLDAVELEPDWGPAAQQCALMQARAGDLSHEPPRSWECWTAAGASSAGHSNLSLGTENAADAVSGQIVDHGANNADRLGHRRWLLLPNLARIGAGFVSEGPGAACIAVIDDERDPTGPEGTSGAIIYPPPGYVPLEVVREDGSSTSNPLRWSVTAFGVDFEAARVAVVEERPDGDVPLEVSMGQLGSLLGDAGIWIEPAFAPRAGARYRVEVSGLRGGTLTWRTIYSACE